MLNRYDHIINWFDFFFDSLIDVWFLVALFLLLFIIYVTLTEKVFSDDNRVLRTDTFYRKFFLLLI